MQVRLYCHSTHRDVRSLQANRNKLYSNLKVATIYRSIDRYIYTYIFKRVLARAPLISSHFSLITSHFSSTIASSFDLCVDLGPRAKGTRCASLETDSTVCHLVIRLPKVGRSCFHALGAVLPRGPVLLSRHNQVDVLNSSLPSHAVTLDLVWLRFHCFRRH